MAAMPRDKIEELFQRFFKDAGNPPDMAVFMRSETEGRLHCEVMAYFSPAAVAVAKEFDGYPCAKPALAGLSLLAGDERSWSVLFPESAM